MPRCGNATDAPSQAQRPMAFAADVRRKLSFWRRLARTRWILPLFLAALIIVAFRPIFFLSEHLADDETDSKLQLAFSSSNGSASTLAGHQVSNDILPDLSRNASDHVDEHQQHRSSPSSSDKIGPNPLQKPLQNESSRPDLSVNKVSREISRKGAPLSVADTPFSERPHDVMPSPSPWPYEVNHPPADLYGTSGERCFALGVNSEAESLWQVNSRALCYIPSPVCLSGQHLENFITFKPRGSGSCELLEVESGRTRHATSKELDGSCARFRSQRIARMFASEEWFHPDFETWLSSAEALSKNQSRRVVEWHASGPGELAIVIPKYDWSWNICHYNRIWQYALYVIRNLGLFIPNPDAIRSVQILFRAKSDYHSLWAVGMREATLSAMQRQTGLRITVGKVRHSPKNDFQCFPRLIVLGQEGRVDAYPFLNDSAIWTKDSQVADDHIPIIPHDALWLREVTYRSFGFFESAAEIAENGTFTSIPVPPLTVSNILRSPNSKRRFSEESRMWFDTMLLSLAENYGLDVRYTRFNGAMKLSEQAGLMRGIGMAVGIHGANFVNTMFMSPAGALFEIFPWRYVRYYYAGGANSGLRYSFHEVSHGQDHHCDYSTFCFMKYRESVLDLNDFDRSVIVKRLDRAMRYLRNLHDRFPSGRIPLLRRGNVYSVPLS